MLSFRAIKDKILQRAWKLGDEAGKNRQRRDFGVLDNLSIEETQKLIQQADRILHGKFKRRQKEKGY